MGYIIFLQQKEMFLSSNRIIHVDFIFVSYYGVKIRRIKYTLNKIFIIELVVGSIRLFVRMIQLKNH